MKEINFFSKILQKKRYKVPGDIEFVPFYPTRMCCLFLRREPGCVACTARVHRKTGVWCLSAQAYFRAESVYTIAIAYSKRLVHWRIS